MDQIGLGLHALITGLILWIVREVKSLAVIVARLEQHLQDKPWRQNGERK